MDKHNIGAFVIVISVCVLRAANNDTVTQLYTAILLFTQMFGKCTVIAVYNYIILYF